MVNGPPCATCGTALRWLPEQNAWGCDRCRVMFPAQQAAPIQNAYQPQHAPPRPGSRKTLAIVAGLVVIGGIVGIVVATRGGKPAGGDMIDLQNQEFATVRDQVCECKDEKCARDALDRMDEIMKRTGESGLTPSKEQDAKAHKILDEMAACVKKVSDGVGPSSDVVSDLVALRDAMCACKTKACAEELQPKFDRWRDKYKSGFDALPVDVRREALAVAKAQQQCYQSALRGE
jgi:hypothetical protein